MYIPGIYSWQADYLSHQTLDQWEWFLHLDVLCLIYLPWGTPDLDILISCLNRKVCGENEGSPGGCKRFTGFYLEASPSRESPDLKTDLPPCFTASGFDGMAIDIQVLEIRGCWDQ